MVEVLPVPGGPYRRRWGRRFESTNLLMVARMSWWPETSARVAGRYFSTLAKVQRVTPTLDERRDRVFQGFSPWQAVLCLDWQVGGASFALCCVVRREGNVLGRRRDINVHLVLKVGHLVSKAVCLV